MMTSLDHTIKLINTNIAAAQDHLTEILEAMQLLQGAGMYPAIPHFQWQRREEMGEAKYLYLIFRQNSDGSHQGPDGRKKIYIGADPANIEEAKRLVRNRERWEQLGQQSIKLRGWITITEKRLSDLERQSLLILKESQEWPRFSANGIAA